MNDSRLFVTRPSALLAAVLVTGLFALCACGAANPDTTEGAAQTTATSQEKAFTIDELARFDGLEGRPAYVAVDGIVYDVSGSPNWPEGTHSRCDIGAAAGKDLSEVIRSAPANMRALVERMPVVGRVAQ